MEQKLIISALVDNESGVLQRVAGLFSRRGFNIESLTVCNTEEPAFSRMTIVSMADPNTFRQIEKQLLKLEIVRKVEVMTLENAIMSELILVKVKAKGIDCKNAILALNQRYGSRVRDVSLTSMTLELTGVSEVLNQFIEEIEKYGIIELARTGVSALERGESSITDDLDL